MSRPLIVAIICIILSVSGLISTGCGLFSYPGDGGKALSANTTFIKFEIHIVDDAGKPLEGVTVTVVRHALSANIIMPGTFDETKPDQPRVVDKVFHYNSLGNCAVTVTFGKPGYANVTATYSNVDVIKPTPTYLMAPHGIKYDYACINVSHHPAQTIIMTRTAASEPSHALERP